MTHHQPGTAANGGARTALRTATAPDHDRVDALFSRLDLSNRADYVRFVTAQAAAHLPVEDALTAAGAAEVLPDWPDRRRGAMLHQDLAALEVPTPPPFAAPALDGDAAILGAVYVLEGSRLGGQLLARSVPLDWPKSFLTAPASGAWRKLIQVLDTRLTDAVQQRIAIEAARAVFMLFEHSGKAFLSQEESWKISDRSI